VADVAAELRQRDEDLRRIGDEARIAAQAAGRAEQRCGRALRERESLVPAQHGVSIRGNGKVTNVPAHVLIPVKALDGAKSRLAGALPPGERVDLVLELLRGVVAAIHGAGIDRVTLVTPEPLSLPGVARFDDGGAPWNDALALALREVEEPVAAVVAADLPLLRAEEVLELLEATPARGIAIARAGDGGTNGVSMRPPAALRTCFGEPQSARLHAELARAQGLEHAFVDLPGLAFDVDRPEDLARLRAA
jgi:2-phospho-L-lactate guanylyltransferase